MPGAGPQGPRRTPRLGGADAALPANPAGFRWTRRNIVVAAALSFLALATGWWIFSEGLADQNARARPEAALRWRPDHPRALARLAEHRLLAGDITGAEALARRAIAADPLESGGFHVLALAAEAKGDEAAADRLMTIAGRRDKRDVAVQTSLFARRLVRGRLDEAAAAADGLMRAWPRTQREPMTGALALVAAQPGGARAVAKVLATDPPWRSRFLTDLARRAPDAAALFDIYSALRTGPKPPTEYETQVYVERLVREGRNEEAFLAWAQLLPAAALTGLGDLYDGGFEGAPGPPPFNWQFLKPKGVVVEIVRGAAGREGGVLHVAFSGGRASPLLVRQLLVLPPGRHVITGEVRAENLETVRGLRWTLRCATGDKAMLAETDPVLTASDWRPFRTVVDLGPDSCRSQWLTLEIGGRLPAERKVAGRLWFDDLRITRANPVGA